MKKKIIFLLLSISLVLFLFLLVIEPDQEHEISSDSTQVNEDKQTSMHYLLSAELLRFHVIKEGEHLKTEDFSSDSLSWSELGYLDKEKRKSLDKLLYRVALPDSLKSGEMKRMFFIGYYSPFKVFYNNKQIYSDSTRAEFIHLLSIDYQDKEKYVYFEYDDYIPGYPVPFSLMFLNEDPTDTDFLYLVVQLFFVQILNYSVSVFFYLIALISLLLMIKSSKSLRKYLWAVFIYSLVIGLDHGLNTLLMSYIGFSPKLYYWLDSIMFQLYLLLTITMADYIFAEGKVRFLKYIKSAIIIFTIINFMVTNTIQYYDALNYVNIFLYLLTIVSMLFVIIKNFRIIKLKISMIVAIVFITGPLSLYITDNFSYVPYVSLAYVIISVVILYVFVYSFFARFRKNESALLQKNLDLQQKENEILRLERERLRMNVNHLKGQLNPHFLFNSLSTLISIINIDQDKAVNYVEELSTMYRYVLQTDSKEMIDLESELDFLDSFTYLLHIKYGDNYVINFDIEDKYLNYNIPPLSLQTLIENVAKHNTIDKENKMYIDIYNERDFLIIINNLNEKNKQFQYKSDSIGIGQMNLQKIYKFYTNKKPEFKKKDGYYIAKIPLIERKEKI